MARFDWYQATVQGDVRPLMGALQGATPIGGTWEPMQRAPHGYGNGQRLLDGQGQVCMVWWGGTHERPHVVSSGETSPAVAEVLRTEYAGAHWCTRVDVCQDYAEPGAYERLQELALAVAADKGIKVGTAGDHLLTKQGRTVYLGASSSHTRLRLYEKADELRQQYRNDLAKLATVPEHLARLECQVRPQTKEAKALAAAVEPMAIMGSAAWMRELMRRVAGLELEPFEAGKPWRQADDDRAYAALLAQYGGLLERVRVDLGSWDMVGRQIGHDLAERAERRRLR